MICSQPIVSIIIPVYNGAETIVNCINSILTQQVEKERYEIIVIDDCSTDNTVYTIKEGFSPDLVTLITLTTNSRQGAARNVGVKAATGKYILYLDADDLLISDSLEKLIEFLDLQNVDLVMYDYETRTQGGRLLSPPQYTGNTQILCTGEEYLGKAQVPWVPWLTAFRRKFLIDNNIFFVEGVRFEDSDYVLKSCLLAKSVIYIYIVVVCHIDNPFSTVHIGNDVQKVRERFMSAERIYRIHDSYRNQKPAGANCIFGHYVFKYDSLLKTTLWRLDAKNILDILKEYPFRGVTTKSIIRFVNSHPKLYAYTSQIAKPLLLFVIKIRNSIKSRKLRELH